MKQPHHSEHRLLTSIRNDFVHYRNGNLTLAKTAREIGHNSISYGADFMTLFIYQDKQGKRYLMIYTDAKGFVDIEDMVDKMEFMHGGALGAQASGAKYMAILLGCLEYFKLVLASKCEDGTNNVVQVLGSQENDYTITEVEQFAKINEIAKVAGVKDSWGEWKNCWMYEICDENTDITDTMFGYLRALGDDFLDYIDVKIPSSPRAIKYIHETASGEVLATGKDGQSGGSRLDPLGSSKEWEDKYMHDSGAFTFERIPFTVLQRIGGKEYTRDIEAEIEVVPIVATTPVSSKTRYQERAPYSSFSVKTIPVDVNGIPSTAHRKQRICNEPIQVGKSGSIFPSLFIPSIAHKVTVGTTRSEYTFVVRVNLYVPVDSVNSFSDMNGAFYTSANSEAVSALKQHVETAIRHLMSSQGSEYDTWLKTIKSEWPLVKGKYPQLSEGGIKKRDKLDIYKTVKGELVKVLEIEPGDTLSNLTVKRTSDGETLTPEELETLTGIRGCKVNHNKGAERISLECFSPYIRRGTSKDSYEFCYTKEALDKWVNGNERGTEYGPHHHTQMSVAGIPHYTDIIVTPLPKRAKQPSEPTGDDKERQKRTKGSARNLSDPTTIFRTDIPLLLMVGYDKSNETLLIPDDGWFHEELWVNHSDYINKYEPKVKEFYAEASEFARESLARYERRHGAKFGVCTDKVEGWGTEHMWVYIADRFEEWYESNNTAKYLKRAVRDFRTRLGLIETSKDKEEVVKIEDKAHILEHA